MSGKHYYWLRLKDDFFTSKRIKKLRAMAGGDTYLIIYLKMQLVAMKSDGVLTWTGLEDSFADELALDLDEKPDDVAMTLVYLLKTGLAETQDQVNFFFPYAVENVGCETSAAERMRKMRERNNVTPVLHERYVEIEKEKEIEKEIETDIVSDKPKRFQPPSVDEVEEYCRERGNSVDAQNFVDWYTANGWKVGKNPMKDWKAAVRTWEHSTVKKETKSQSKYMTAAEYKNQKQEPIILLDDPYETFGKGKQ